jgi:hypothetical protein
LVPETLNPAFAGTLITNILDLFTGLNGQNRRIDTEYAFINGPVGPERNMGLGLTILNQREVFYQL